ncbi:protein argonaute 12-like isoform X2 [Cebus imitator]|uniref:protein argonaute 12-like isoform X2 n=1 Tax=Cebus imitator TaxID=2715852 RepID=UPI001897C095|nr:protein argonaute 12-like isoform X2 [Cebus imitator]
MPPGEEEGGGRPGGGRAGGGAQTRGGGFEGQRGREAGSVGGEGEEARAERGWGRGRGESVGRERKGWRERSTRRVQEDPSARPFSCCPVSQSLPASPSSLLSRPGAPDVASQLPGWRGRGSNCKTFRKLHGVVGPGLRGLAGPGRGVQLTQVARPRPAASAPPSRLFLPTSPAAQQPSSPASMPRRTPPPVCIFVTPASMSPA